MWLTYFLENLLLGPSFYYVLLIVLGILYQIKDYVVCFFYTQSNYCHFIKLMLLYAIQRIFLENRALGDRLSTASMIEVNTTYLCRTDFSYSVPFHHFVHMVKRNSGEKVVLACFSISLCCPKICCLNTRLISN